MENEMLSVVETCTILNMSTATLSRKRKNDESFPKPRMKNKKELYFVKSEIMKWAEQNKNIQ